MAPDRARETLGEQMDHLKADLVGGCRASQMVDAVVLGGP